MFYVPNDQTTAYTLVACPLEKSWLIWTWALLAVACNGGNSGDDRTASCVQRFNNRGNDDDDDDDDGDAATAALMLVLPVVYYLCIWTPVQVTGYVLIATNAIESLGLNNLRIIRGESLYSSSGETDEPTKYSLYIALNYHMDHLPSIGLLELQLTSLRGE